MPSQLEHDWNISPADAHQVQLALRERVRIEPLPISEVKTVGGVDASYREGRIYAAVAILELPGLALLGQACAEMPVSFPYIPGLLSFRELPAILSAVGKLSNLPDVFIVDGHGLAHPRRFGLASHLGVLLDVPSIGCAKSLLVGEVAILDALAGSQAELTLDGQVIGIALRTREHVKPVYFSIGHRIILESALEITMACLSEFRLPEPVRRAHALAAKMRNSI